MSTLQGTYTALITPFKPNPRARKEFSVDYARFRKLVDYQISWGVDGILVLGTTGETPMLDTREKKRLVKIARDAIDESKRNPNLFGGKKPKLIIGTGTIDSFDVYDSTKWAKGEGADAALVVAPYYVKPNMSGMIKHFKQVDKAKFPFILYNVPSRTAGTGITIEMYKELAQLENVIGTKEASGDIKLIKQVIDEVKTPLAEQGKEFSVLSGDDNLTFPTMEAGGDGVISVIANAVPKQARDLTDAMLAGNAEKAEEVSPMLYQLAAFAFIDGNPVSIKYIMKSMGLIKHDCCRLPLGPMASDKSVTLEKFLEKFLKSEKAR